MKFSIIMPTFNRQTMILKAIDAILRQSYTNWELIIQNGGNRIDIPKDERIIYVEQKDNGIADAIKKASRFITGDYCIWNNDDDEMNSDVLEFLSNNLNNIC